LETIVRPQFRRLRELAEANAAGQSVGQLRHLSMGMSGDFEVAIEEGATHIRLGSVLFGARGG
ncbi:MAG: YggS family pyridoxal phosphate enzyme, partial [Bacteroidetes bacterium]|nr:YggS family pyridoxal phosphate enzyme [Bacteroidota bacterium]